MLPKARLSKDKNNHLCKNCRRINISELMAKFALNKTFSCNTMLPFRNMEDSVGDLSKLFPNTRSNDDVFNFSSPFQTMANKSSSSADSTSPESYFDPFHVSETIRRSDLFTYERAQYDTTLQYNLSLQYERSPLYRRTTQSHMPNIISQTVDVRLNAQAQDFVPLRQYINEPSFQIRRQRAIIGRKIDCQTKPKDEIENIWQSPIQKSYELFPSDSADRNILGFQTPVKPTSNISNVSPVSSSSITTPRMPSFNLFNPSSSRDMGSKLCTFCKKNGERSNVYLTHSVKEKIGNRHVVTCPILRSHVCETCGATNDDAHTITYCPVLRNNNNGRPLQSTTITLKNTRIKSNGRRRY